MKISRSDRRLTTKEIADEVSFSSTSRRVPVKLLSREQKKVSQEPLNLTENDLVLPPVSSIENSLKLKQFDSLEGFQVNTQKVPFTPSESVKSKRKPMFLGDSPCMN